jgi:hypothetical protein
VLLSGDDVLAAVLAPSRPQGRPVVTKRALGRFQADTPHPSVVCAGLREAARQALGAAGAIVPYVPSRPVTLELQFHHPMYTDLAAMVPGCRKTGTWSAAFTGDTFMAAFGAFDVCGDGHRLTTSLTCYANTPAGAGDRFDGAIASSPAARSSTRTIGSSLWAAGTRDTSTGRSMPPTA